MHLSQFFATSSTLHNLLLFCFHYFFTLNNLNPEIEKKNLGIVSLKINF